MLPGDYTTNVTIAGKTLWLDGTGATLNASSTLPTFQINDAAHVRITGLNITDLGSTTNGAVRCETVAAGATPILEFDQVSIDSPSAALVTRDCSLTATRSTFHVASNQGGSFVGFAPSTVNFDRCIFDGGDGIQAINQGSVVRVTNSLIKNMTGPDGGLIGRSYVFSGQPPPPGKLTASFVTLVNSPLICASGAPACLSGTAVGVCVDNSVITSAVANSVTGTGCVLNYSLAFPQGAALTGANNLAGVDPSFADAAGNNFQLSGSSPAIDAADPAATNAIDLLGAARPQGLRDDLGAYEHHL